LAQIFFSAALGALDPPVVADAALASAAGAAASVVGLPGVWPVASALFFEAVALSMTSFSFATAFWIALSSALRLSASFMRLPNCASAGVVAPASASVSRARAVITDWCERRSISLSG
jgi:hypothetical protein